MANRWSPSVLPREPDFDLAGTITRLFAAREAGQRDDEEREERTRLQELELALRGIRRGQAPTTSEPASGPTLGEARRATGMEPAGEPVFVSPDSSGSSEFGTLRRMLQPPQRTAIMPQVPEAEIPGGILPPQGPSAPEQDPYVMALGEARLAGRGAFPTEPPRMLAPPGAYVPGVGFTPRALYEERPEFGLQRPAMVERPDPRFEQLTPDFYRESEPDETEQLVADLVAEGIPENRARIIAKNPSLLDNVLFPREERPQAPVRGTPEYLQALRDELRIREEFQNEGGGAGGQISAGEERTLRRMEREAEEYAELVAREGGRRGDATDVRNIAQLVRAQFPELPATTASAIASRAIGTADRGAGEERRRQRAEVDAQRRQINDDWEAGIISQQERDERLRDLAAPPAGEQATRAPLAQRIAELKASGVSREEARATLRREGYAVQ